MTKAQEKREWKRLYNKCYKLWKECCFARDGKSCQVKKYFPWIDINHSDVIQVDHAITRMNKWYHLDPSNGTVVCSTCNMHKNNKQYSVDRIIDSIVSKREEQKFRVMVEMDFTGKPNLEFKTIGYMERQLVYLGEKWQQFSNKGKKLPSSPVEHLINPEYFMEG